MRDNQIETLIADGEGVASPLLLQWTLDDRVIDVLQYSSREKGPTFWRKISAKLAAQGQFAHPHNFGSSWSCWATCHLSAAINCWVEWDIGFSAVFSPEAFGPIIVNGTIAIPEKPGFGLVLDIDAFKNCDEYFNVVKEYRSSQNTE